MHDLILKMINELEFLNKFTFVESWNKQENQTRTSSTWNYNQFLNVYSRNSTENSQLIATGKTKII
jgi:hypothetical protein